MSLLDLLVRVLLLGVLTGIGVVAVGYAWVFHQQGMARLATYNRQARLERSARPRSTAPRTERHAGNAA